MACSIVYVPSYQTSWAIPQSIRIVMNVCSSDLMDVNIGVPQGSVLSTTLFLLHVNNLLNPGTFERAADSTVVENYIIKATRS